MLMKRTVLLGLIGLVGAGMMTGAQGASTRENLLTAYEGESKARIRYEAFAAKAEQEGYQSVAALFRATAKSESIHAAKHAAMLEKMGATPVAPTYSPEVKGTRENLETALAGETAEKTKLYPEFLKQAEAEKLPGAAMSMRGAMASEGSHAVLFQKALSDMEAWKAPGKEFAVCLVCGYTMMTPFPGKCPICAAPRSKFDMIR